MNTIASSTVLAAVVAGIVSLITFFVSRNDNRDEVSKKITRTVDLIAADLKSLREEFRQGRAISARIRILSASDEVTHGVKHSSEWWDQVLEDITFYCNYCDMHPGFKNKKAEHAVENLDKVHLERIEKNDFI